MELTHEEHRELQHALQGDLELPSHLTDRFDKHLQHCRECQRLLRGSGRIREKIRKNFQASAHLSQEQLLFHLTAAGDGDLPAADLKMLQRHRAHLKICALCRLRERNLQQELARCEQAIFETAEEFAAPVQPVAAIAGHQSTGKPYWSLALAAGKSLAGAGAVYLLLFAVSTATLPEGFEDQDLRREDYRLSLTIERSLSGDPALPQIAQAENELAQGHFERTLHLLAGVEQHGLEYEALLRLRLYELMATLKTAQTGLLLLFPRFDEQPIAAQLERMEAVLSGISHHPEQSQGPYLGLAYYYSAKACLILNRPNDACAYLAHSMQLPPHKRRQEARALHQKRGCS